MFKLVIVERCACGVRAEASWIRVWGLRCRGSGFALGVEGLIFLLFRQIVTFAVNFRQNRVNINVF